MIMMFAAAASPICTPGHLPGNRGEVVRSFIQETVEGRYREAERRILPGAPYIDYSSGKTTTVLETLREIAASKSPVRISILQHTEAGGVVAAKMRFGAKPVAVDAITVFRVEGQCIAGVYAF